MKKNILALGRLKTGQKNQTETAYDGHLRLRLLAGEVAWYAFEAIKLRLSDGCFYTPDFVVMLANGELEIHEVKGFWRDDARVKIKIAAEMFPLRCLAVTRGRGGKWEVEEF